MHTHAEFAIEVLRGNAQTREDLEKFRLIALPSLLHLHNPEEIPTGRVEVDCADGRLGGLSTLTQDPSGLVRFTSFPLPTAGCILNGTLLDMNLQEDPAGSLDALLGNPGSRDQLFAELQLRIGPAIDAQRRLSHAVTLAGKALLFRETCPADTPSDVRMLAEYLMHVSGETLLEALRQKDDRQRRLFLQKIAALPQTGYPIPIEFRSHSDPYDKEHGCGAFDSDLPRTLQMTAINAFVADAFLREEYGDSAQQISVVRTHHFTGNGEQIVDAGREDLLSQIHPVLADRMRSGRTNFQPLHYKDQATGLVRKGKKNPFSINQDTHDERVIRVSQDHRAHILQESVLEQTMPGRVDHAHILAKTLITIALNHRIKREPEQPLFVHLDRQRRNPSVLHYAELRQRLLEDPQFRPLLTGACPKIVIVQTESEALDLMNPHALRTRILDR